MLDDEAIARYARQIVVPGIGATGQQRLLASTVLVTGNERGSRQAALYLRAAGVRVLVGSDAAAADTADVVILAQSDSLNPEARAVLVAAGKPVCWYLADEEGFTAGVHPAAVLPAAALPAAALPAAALPAAALAALVPLAAAANGEPPDSVARAAGNPEDNALCDAVHDAAACDAAAVACAILVGLAWRSGPYRF